MPQRLRILKPPTMSQLWDDPVYRACLERKPKLPDNLSHGQPWMLVARLHDDDAPKIWKHRLFADYFEALDLGLELLDRPKYDDVSIVSRRRFFRPFIDFTWEPRFQWCGRCRRPTLYRKPGITGSRHHALRDAPAVITDSTEDLYRCYFCGMRRAAQPTYKERFSNA